MNAKYVLALLLTLCPGSVLLARQAPPAAPAEPPKRTDAAGTGAPSGEKKAKRVPLQARCARCHDEDGAGRKGRSETPEIPDFSSHKWQASRTDGQLLVSILEGKGDHMPAYRDKLSEKEARDMVAQVRGLDPTPSAPAAPRTDGASDDFERRFAELKKELEDLKRQTRELSEPPRKP